MQNDVPTNFCHQCGANLGELDQFCPACGAYTEDTVCDHVSKPLQQDRGRGARLTVALALSAIWSVAGVLLGLWMVFGAQTMADYNWGMISDFYPSMTVQEFKDMMMFQGYLTLGSGGAAIVATLLCYVRRHRVVAVAACVAGGILAMLPTAYIGGVVAFFVAFLIFTSKPPVFED
ncbi:MAG: zinc ribbon domain-containing protein [Candidatus Methanoplasma sp.]|nr:zinc ribbon domain-containing protein [Candidatus Methanoplasma sp.]